MAGVCQADVDRPRAIGSVIVKSAAGRPICRRNPPVMRFDDGADDREPHPHALRFVVKNGSKILLRSPVAMPGPVSLILISALAPERFVATLISRSFASASDIASIALIIRFRKTCCS